MVDAELSEMRSQIGELQHNLLAQTRAVAEHDKKSAKRVHSLEGRTLNLEKRMEKRARVETTPVTARLLHSSPPAPPQMVSVLPALAHRVPLGEIHSNLPHSIVRAGAAPRAKTQHQQGASINHIRPFAAPGGLAASLSPRVSAAPLGLAASLSPPASPQLVSILPVARQLVEPPLSPPAPPQMVSVLPVARPISLTNYRNDIARIVASPPLLREFLTELAPSCDEIDEYAQHPSAYSKAEKKKMDGRVAAGRDAQGKLSLCILASTRKAGKLGDLSAPCALNPGMFGACTEDAVLASSTDPTKKRYIEAKTCGEVARDSNGNSAHYHVMIRMRHDDGKRTQWETLMGFLRPAGANFRVFRTPEDTLSEIFDNMADSGYEVFIAHRPKMVECAREGEKDHLRLDPRIIQSSVPICATSGKGKGSKTWLNEAVTARFSFQKLRDEPGLLARLLVV